ncbi:MAG TPA: hypothetical protein GX699_03200 [Firmicutes bacterium]|nr:hypothetical protein [Bacillota bacterium]
MKRFGILLLVCLLLATGIMAAMAASNVTITNPASFVTVTTDNALLALDINEGVGHKDKTAYIDEDGMLHFNFAAGLKTTNPQSPWKGTPFDADYGMQPGSVYIFKDLFKITNNSFETIKFKIRVEGDLADFDYMYIGKGAEGFSSTSFTMLEDGSLQAPKPPLHSNISWYYPGNNWNTINPAIKHNNYKWVSIAFVVPEGADITDLTGTIVVDAWAE